MQIQTEVTTMHNLPADSLTVMEATLTAGVLMEQAAAEPSGRKWRVRIFEYHTLPDRCR